jgi:hypothetical protein
MHPRILKPIPAIHFIEDELIRSGFWLRLEIEEVKLRFFSF